MCSAILPEASEHLTVANAIKLLQVCKYRALLELTRSQRYCQIYYAFSEKLKYFEVKSKNKHEHSDFDNT